MKALAGDQFDEAKFNELKDEEGFVSKEALLALAEQHGQKRPRGGNGNNAPTGDAWTTLEVVVPGEAYTGPLTPDEGIDGVSSSDRVLLVVGLVLIAGLVWAVARP